MNRDEMSVIIGCIVGNMIGRVLLKVHEYAERRKK